MSNSSHNTDLPRETWRELREVLTKRRHEVFTAWKARIQATAVLQLREDLDAQTPPLDVLEEFYDLIVEQLATPGEYYLLRLHIFSGAINAFTPDAACRLLIALKKTVLETLAATPDLTTPDLAHFTGMEAVIDELLLRVSEYYHEMRYRDLKRRDRAHSRDLRTSEDRFRTLVETMNEGFTALDTDEYLVFFNQRIEQITGYHSDEIIGKHVSELYTPESAERLRNQLQRRRRGESSSYQLHAKHKDGSIIPVRISGAPIKDTQGNHVGSFAVITDISEQIETETILRQRNEENARLLEIEKRRTDHFSTINRVAQMALSTLKPEEIFRGVVRVVHESFGYQHVSLYLVDEESGKMVMQARSGVYEAHFPEGYRQDIGAGIVGRVVSSGDPLLSNDVASDNRRIIAFPEEATTQAELCVPIKTGDRVLGAIDVLSRDRGVFDQTDVQSLQILADQLAWVIHNARLYQATLELKEFNDQVLQTIPLPVILLDPNTNVVFANNGYLDYHGLRAEEVIDYPLAKSRPSAFLVTPEGRNVLSQVFASGESRHLTSLNIPTGSYQNRVVDLLITRLETAQGSPLALVVIEDITESLEKAYESSLLRQISQTMQGILDVDRLLYTILTCVTAGTGLGFNRAILLQVDADEQVLEGKMGVGPANQTEASRIWSELAHQNPTVEDILAAYDQKTTPWDSALARAATQISISLDDPEDVLARAVRERRTFTVTDDHALSISLALWAALGTHHFVVTPLVAQDHAVGVIVADNLYSGAPITEDSVDLLRAFAGHAALALENAGLYGQLEEKINELERTQEELVQSERLAVIGELSAQIAHEIRNPLATIGGFARAMLRKPDPERTQTAARVISEEVTRLEDLLTDILNYTRPRQILRQPTDLKVLIQSVFQMIAEGLEERGITYAQQIPDNLPDLLVDADQIKQVLINLLKNAYQAMAEGGELAIDVRLIEAYQIPRTDAWVPGVEIEIRDTGEGIDPDIQGKLFSPYFTTKTTGTGLGLAISKQIIERHGGAISLESHKGCGTSVFIRLPQQPASAEGVPA